MKDPASPDQGNVLAQTLADRTDYRFPVCVPSGEWGTLRVVAIGNHFEVHHNGKELYEVEDETLKEAGKIGLWTKADSVIYFDDLQMTVK